MKKMTCAQMGGECDAEIMGATSDEMITNGMKHLDESHPEMAAQIHATPETDPMMVEWSKKFMADFDAAPEI
jgi:predicted small metal-binding protein